MAKNQNKSIFKKTDKSETKTFIWFISFTFIVIILLIGLGMWIGSNSSSNTSNTSSQRDDGKQVINIMAKGGYKPTSINAKADTDSVLRITTNKSYDCSSEIIIRAINYTKVLPPTGVTEVNIPAQKSGSSITGVCSMGMYQFNIKFS